LEEREFIPWSSRDESFQFVRALLVILDTPKVLQNPHDLLDALKNMGQHSLFYHFIDSRRRTLEGADDFSEWLQSFGDEYKDLVQRFREINPYFITMQELNQKLIEVCEECLSKRAKL